ncbi:hypothetical protein ScPMuIL_006478 [Solemya velum]
MEVIGDYEYNKKDLIGHGAFAVVFKGRYVKKAVPVAIKSITKKNLAKSQNLLSKEIKILKELSDLHHENVVALLDCKETTNHVYLVMEYCNGGDLADYLQTKGTLSEDTIAVFLRQIAAAMRALNAKGIVHRDLKPQNILLCNVTKSCAVTKATKASDIKLKIADFGFARFLQDGVMAATLCGSPMYMAPEVIMSLQYDAKADLWSIGTIVFQCLTGKAPFQAQTPQQLKQFYEKHSELAPNIPKDTSPELTNLLHNLLKRNAKDRIEFEKFFVHAFLRPTASSPVAVPSRNNSFDSNSSTVKTVTSSPLSGNVQDSPPLPPTPSPKINKRKNPVPVIRPSHRPREITKVPIAEPERCDSPAEDFVMVPESMQCDSSGQYLPTDALLISIFSDQPPPSLNPVTVSPTVGSAVYKKPEKQTSPSRPTTLPVTATTTTSPKVSEPIPVPTQVKAFQRLQNISPSSPSGTGKLGDTSPMDQSQSLEKSGSLHRNHSDTRLAAPNMGSLSPPSVQFTIGTPPKTGHWRRGSVDSSPWCRYNNNPPSVTGSPIRKSSEYLPRLSPLPFGVPGSLPTILGSPTKLPVTLDYTSPNNAHTDPSHAFSGTPRTQTVPDNLAAITQSKFPASDTKAHIITTQACSLEHGRCQTEPNITGDLSGRSPLTQHMFRAAFGHQAQGTVVPISGWGSRERMISQGSDTGSDKDASPFNRRNSAFMETSPPSSLLFAQSPPNMEGPITFVAPELAEDTLMDDHYKEVMAKLHFVLDLVECILDFAGTRGTSLSSFTESFSCRQGEHVPSDQMPKFTEAQRRLEQLVLYIRSLHLLSISLQLARNEIKSGQLEISTSLRTVVRQLNEHYRQAITTCRQLQQRLGLAFQAALTPQVVVATADKLIYNHAIEMCQTAALMRFGNPQEIVATETGSHALLVDGLTTLVRPVIRGMFVGYLRMDTLLFVWDQYMLGLDTPA